MPALEELRLRNALCEELTAAARLATVRIARGAVAFMVNHGRDVSALSLCESTTGDVTVKVGGQDIELRAGEQIVITGSRALSFGDANPIPGVACRDLREHTLEGGQRAFICQFSIASAMDNLKTIKQLSHSPEARDRAIHAKILKNAAILHMVTARKGPYKTWRKTDINARAIQHETHRAEEGALCKIGTCYYSDVGFLRCMNSMLDWNQCPLVEQSPDKVSGAWVFEGTRVPVRALFENLEDGATIDDFLEWFPGVSHQQVMAVLEFTEQSLASA